MASILFVLPVGGYSGGANSVVQETKGLNRVGQRASIAVDEKNIDSFKRCYSTEFDIISNLVCFKDYNDLLNKIRNYDVVVATVGTQATNVFSMVRNHNSNNHKKITLAYYIQDYEPLFFEKDTPEWQKTRASYDEASDVICFAKTDWICNIVQKNHNVSVKRVLPSIDHDCYIPSAEQSSKITISAMIRPGTPRRAPHRTARILNILSSKYKKSHNVNVVSFGCQKETLQENGIILDPAISHQGQLTREQVAQVLRESSLFLDLSDFQAFGRTGIESMACGAVPVMPVFGGAQEFVVDKQNGYLVDPRFDSSIINAIDDYLALTEKRKRVMRNDALNKAAEFSIHRAALSMSCVLTQ
ncbi:glycosyltransferase family 4 protein [Pokkaliibacter plantistimulans]|nr:glycosyltransferase family 4 protein [Pokkaliibacter plantistimulans]